MKQRGDKQPTWTFSTCSLLMRYWAATDIPQVNKRLKDTPFIGAAHATDLVQSFGDFALKDYIIRCGFALVLLRSVPLTHCMIGSR